MQNKVVLKINWYGLCKKCMVSMAIRYIILNNVSRPTKSIVTRVLLIIEH